jgi:hypothetical protein
LVRSVLVRAGSTRSEVLEMVAQWTARWIEMRVPQSC